MKLKATIGKAFGRRVTITFFALAPLVLRLGIPPANAAGAEVSGSSGATAASSEPIVFFDATDLFKLDLNDGRQRRQYWDQAQLLAALEGLVNRDRPRLFIRYLQEPDDFWWKQMTQPGGWLAGREIVKVGSLDDLLARYRAYYHGAVIWDERVPATANLASTVAGCDDLLPVRYDPAKDSLYTHLTQAPGALPIVTRLLGEDGSRLFTGTGTIPGTSLASTGSAKCDAYLWLIEKYVKTGKANPLCMGYYVDAFWLNCWNASKPENNTLCNHDYVIARRGVLFDLGVWDDESPVDDPQQRPGTDAATLRKLLLADYNRFHGNGIIQVDGFVPWPFKYTDNKSPAWFSGGSRNGVQGEWQYAKILSCYNACMDADAPGISAMANASFYQHYPLAAHYPQNPKPTRASLIAQGILDGNGQIVPRSYVAFYVGDYDSSAWLYHSLLGMWNDPARGTVPLSWAFNPNLCERFPLGMAWARERRSKEDWFVAGDSGAGYLNPGSLVPPRSESGLPSGLDAWERLCETLYKQWDITLTGFVLEGTSPGLTAAGMNAYARFSPDGIVGTKIAPQGVFNGMPYLRMAANLNGLPPDAARSVLKQIGGSRPSFTVLRTILKTPTWHAKVVKQLQLDAGDQVKVVDLYTLLWLVRAYEGRFADNPASQGASARQASLSPR